MATSASAAHVEEENAPPPIQYRKGELIGCGAFGQVFMGMDLDSGELLAVKQVLIGTSNASAQAHIRDLEEEVNLLKNLSHPNIVRYLGVVRDNDTLNILLELVPGKSISSLLGNLGSFPEPVIRKYTKQLLQGLSYLHRNKIIHRDIKGPNILVDTKGCIKLADFGASKKVAELATMTAAKTMKGTPYWMAPEVILESGHSFSADIWSMGCTVIEMATGKPPWSGQFDEVFAALLHVGSTKSHPPIPEHLSLEAKDFLLKCLQEEPSFRPTACDLLQHPFVTGELEDVHQLNRAGSSGRMMESDEVLGARPIWANGNDDDDMCRIDDDFDGDDDVNRTSDAACEDDDEVTKYKTTAFHDEKENISNCSNTSPTNAASKLPPMSPGGTFSRGILQEISSPQKPNEWVPPEHHSDIQELHISPREPVGSTSRPLSVSDLFVLLHNVEKEIERWQDKNDGSECKIRWKEIKKAHFDQAEHIHITNKTLASKWTTLVHTARTPAEDRRRRGGAPLPPQDLLDRVAAAEAIRRRK